MKTSLKATLIAAAIAALPLGAGAAGLGPINVYSGLGQPLRAEIELKATPQELQTLTARIASADAFRQANVPYAAVIAGLRLAVETQGSRPVVRISSDRPVNDPFVDLLLELNWASGRLIREYTFLLDPVDLAAPAPLAAQAAAPVASSGAARAAAAPIARDGQPAADRYQVSRGDTLRRVAETHRPAGATLEQMLVALFRENPAAFDGGNINRLRAGAILRIPDESAAREVEPAQARREVLAQAADFDAYRARLAGAVAARPAAAEEPASRAAVGTIVPRVDEPARAGDSGDRVKVSGAPSEQIAAGDAARLARLQALEEELVARDKALEEANGRVAELEKSIREFQQLIELRNQSLAQLQQQAAGATAGSAAPDPATTDSATEPANDPAADIAAPAQAAESAAAVAEQPAEQPQTQTQARNPAPVEPVPPPTFLQTLLDDPALLAGGGAALALLLGLAGYKVRQRRKEEEEALAKDALGPLSELPANGNSVFGQSGGQSVDTNSSVIQTDFSQSGLSAIDADEGVDPVAEADVYMAYGRDAQAEEILLDALKADASRAAIYLKLLEIYAQRKSLKQFETVATDLYSRTGGEGADWTKAAELGRALDSDNPLYNSGSAAAKMHAPVTEQPLDRDGRGALGAKAATAAMVGAAAVAPRADSAAQPQPSPSALSDLDFSTSITSGVSSPFGESEPGVFSLPDADAMPADAAMSLADNPLDSGDDIGLMLAPVRGEGDASAVPQVDPDVLDFDLDLGDAPGQAALPEVPAAKAPPAAPAPAEMNDLVFDLDVDEPPAPPASAVRMPEVSETDMAMSLDVADMDAPLVVEPVSFDMDAAPARAPEAGEGADDAVMDLEKTTFDSSLLDFDFDLEASAPETPAKAPTLDLSGIDLDLELPDAPAIEFDPIEPAPQAPTLEMAADSTAGAPVTAEVAQEIDTKLELARAYEEMGDKEGARELIDEVLRDGSAEQRAAAARLMERLA